MDTPPRYQIERYETLAQLDTLEKEWAELIAGIPDAPVFLTWEWIRTWWLYFGQGRELWLLTARDQHGNLLGIAPLLKELFRIGLTKLRIIGFIGVGITHPVHLNILTHPSDPEGLLQSFLDFLLSHSKQWDVIRFTPVAKDSALCGLLAKTGKRYRIGNKTTNIYVPLPENWEIFLKTLTKKLRRNLKYFRSKLEDDYPGSVVFACVTDLGELSGAMKKLEELNKERWLSKKRTSNFAYSNYSTFHEAIASLALERKWLRLYQLKVSGRVIATCYNFRFHDRIYAQAIGFDLEMSGYSPGRLAIANSIQAAIQEAAYEYDWLGGDEAYKLAWTDQIRVENELLFSNNWRGSIWIEWKSAQQVIKEALVTKGRQWLPKSTRDWINQLLHNVHRITESRDDKDAR